MKRRSFVKSVLAVLAAPVALLRGQRIPDPALNPRELLFEPVSEGGLVCVPSKYGHCSWANSVEIRFEKMEDGTQELRVVYPVGAALPSQRMKVA